MNTTILLKIMIYEKGPSGTTSSGQMEVLRHNKSP
ncbi:hypothetical protein J2S21_004199 [Peribacillus cavernae]|nr:hypothetical protein [Peribacillus cavernae]